MSAITECCESCIHKFTGKIFRVSLMFFLTIITAVFEIIFGIRAHSNSLIADGLYSFAEGLCLIGVILILRYSRNEKYRQKHNTFGCERIELLFGLMQEVFLLSVSLGIIVDAINHILKPSHVHDPMLMVVIGGFGIFVGLLGIVMFWGYHHDHDIQQEINKNKKGDFLTWSEKHMKLKRQSSTTSRHQAIPVEIPLMNESTQNEPIDQSDRPVTTRQQSVQQSPTGLEAFTYENVDIKESRIYATLHALCLHSFVVLLESVIVLLSGLLIKFIPHEDPITKQEINVWLKYVDPSLTLIMVVVIAVHAIPVIYSISGILVEDVPAGIDTQILMKEIVAALPAIKSIHSLHVWRASAREIYATLHLVCDEDVMLSALTNVYGRKIGQILKSYCIRYFTLQFEYSTLNQSEYSPRYRCVHVLERQRRGHTLEDPLMKLAKDAIANI